MAKNFEFQGDLSVKNSEDTLGKTRFETETLTITEPFGSYQPNGSTISVDVSDISIEEFLISSLTKDVSTGLIEAKSFWFYYSFNRWRL